MKRTIHIGDLLCICIDAAKKAGNIIRNVWKSGDLQIKDKGFDDLFTAADVKSQQLIMGLLQKHFGPELRLVGEEDCKPKLLSDDDELFHIKPRFDLFPNEKVPPAFCEANVEDLCVFIDPLDATKEFTEGNLEAVMSLIGIGYKGDAIAGVMYMPFVDDENGSARTIYGMIGLGAFGFKLNLRNDDQLVIATTRTHGSKEVEMAIEALKPGKVIRVGGAGHKALLVLEGRVDAYVFPTPGTKKWDTCAPEAILRSVGGTLTDIQGRSYRYFPNSEAANRDGVLCSRWDASKHQTMLVDVLRNHSHP